MATSRAIFMTIGQLSFYDQIKQTLIATGYMKDNPTTHFFSSFLAVSNNFLMSTNCGSFCYMLRFLFSKNFSFSQEKQCRISYRWGKVIPVFQLLSNRKPKKICPRSLLFSFLTDSLLYTWLLMAVGFANHSLCPVFNWIKTWSWFSKILVLSYVEELQNYLSWKSIREIYVTLQNVLISVNRFRLQSPPCSLSP